MVMYTSYQDGTRTSIRGKNSGTIILKHHNTLGFYSSRAKYVEVVEYSDIIRNDQTVKPQREEGNGGGRR